MSKPKRQAPKPPAEDPGDVSDVLDLVLPSAAGLSIEKATVERVLRENNPGADEGDVATFADRFLEYLVAQRGAELYGPVVRGAMGGLVPNPYLNIRNTAERHLKRSGLEADELWELAKRERGA